MPSKPIKCKRGWNFKLDKMQKKPVRWCWYAGHWYLEERRKKPIKGNIIYIRTNRKRQRRYNKYLCSFWLNE